MEKPPTPSTARLPKLQDPKLPTSARADYEAVVNEVALWIDAYKLSSINEQRRADEETSLVFSQYINEAIEDLSALRAKALPASTQIFLIRLLTYLDDRLTSDQLERLVRLMLDEWSKLENEVKNESINFLCDSLYELQRFDLVASQRDVYEFLSRIVAEQKQPPNIIVHVLRGLLVHASGLREDDLTSLADNLDDDWQGLIRKYSGTEPSLARLHSEFLGQYKVLAEFKGFDFKTKTLDDVPPIVSILSRKGGVGKTSLAIALALHYAQTKRVYLLDLDIVGPSLSYYFRFKQPSSILTIEAALSDGISPDDVRRRLFHSPINELPAISKPENFKVAQCSSLGSPRHELYEQLYSGRLEEIRDHMIKILQSIARDADLVIMDNAPGLFGLGLLAMSSTYSSGGLSVFVTSPDIHDVGALQIEMDFFRNVVAADPSASHFRWVCNKVPDDVKEVYESPEVLQYYLRKHPALSDVPGFVEERLVRRYSAPFPKPIIISNAKSMATTFTVTKDKGANVDFKKLLVPLERDSSGFSEICSVVDELLLKDNRHAS
jgi:MinD-like ATPase involved in chromosome partitioning or flagellar assembly